MSAVLEVDVYRQATVGVVSERENLGYGNRNRYGYIRFDCDTMAKVERACNVMCAVSKRILCTRAGHLCT